MEVVILLVLLLFPSREENSGAGISLSEIKYSVSTLDEYITCSIKEDETNIWVMFEDFSPLEPFSSLYFAHPNHLSQTFQVFGIFYVGFPIRSFFHKLFFLYLRVSEKVCINMYIHINNGAGNLFLILFFLPLWVNTVS